MSRASVRLVAALRQRSRVRASKYVAPAACAILGLASCCEKASAPCSSWVRHDETYTAELIQHFEIENDSDFSEQVPYEGYARNEVTCGAMLDIGVGSVVLLSPRARVTRNEPASCINDCFDYDATAEVEGLSVEEELPRLPHFVGTDELYSRFTALVNDECRVTYDIGIAKVEQNFLDQAVEPVPTDFMVFRSVVVAAEDAEACRAYFEAPVPSECWDSWYVRVQNADGQLISAN